MKDEQTRHRKTKGYRYINMKRQTILIKEFEFFYDAIDYVHTIDYEEIIKARKEVKK